jgi:hypothetical protein
MQIWHEVCRHTVRIGKPFLLQQLLPGPTAKSVMVSSTLTHRQQNRARSLRVSLYITHTCGVASYAIPSATRISVLLGAFKPRLRNPCAQRWRACCCYRNCFLGDPVQNSGP